MTRRPPAVLATLLLGLLSIAAGPPVALRVELQPTGAVGDDTTMSITIQVAPEDRTRVGRDVWVQGELLAQGERVDRLARAVDLDDHGQARFDASWPPGDYELRVEIRGAKRGAFGVWAGRVTIPSSGRGTTAEEPVRSQGASAGAVDAGEPAETPPTSTASATADEGGSDVPPAADSSEPSSTAATTAIAATGAAAVGSTPAGGQTEGSSITVEPSATPEPATDATSQPAGVSAEASSEPAPPGPERPVDEPIHEPAATPVPAPVEPVTAGQPVIAAAGATAAVSAWATRGDATADVTVVVTQQNQPILGLTASAFALRVGGANVSLDEIGDAATAPLNLGLVICLAAGSDDLAAEIARQLGGFSLRTRSSGDLFVVTPDRATPQWGATADDIARTVGAAGGGSPPGLARLVADAAGAFQGRRGRRFLVVVTDGGDGSDKAAWKETVAAAEGAGVPIYVVGLRDSGFDDRARSSLTKLASSTGGRSYFLGDAGMAGMTLDYVGQLIDGSYALPFRSPGGPAAIKVEVANRGWTVAYPRQTP